MRRLRFVSFLFSFVVLFHITPAWAMGERPEQDPTCFASDKLRVKIGERVFAFPRNMVERLEGNALPPYKHSKDRYTQAQTLCQKTNEAAFILSEIHTSMLRNKCYKKENGICDSTRVQVAVYPGNTDLYNKDKISYINENFIKRCRDTEEISDEFTKRFGDLCQYVFYYKGLIVWIQFKTDANPKHKIKQTIKKIKHELDSYDITEETTSHPGTQEK